MATLYCAGPTHIFLAFPTGAYPYAVQAPYYLGTCEDAPVVEIKPLYREVRNDIGGETAFDLSYQGEHALIEADLNRWNEGVYAALAARPRPGVQGAVRGSNNAGDVGSLIFTEGLGVQLYLLFQFGAAGSAPKAAYIQNGLPPGYRFPVSIPIGPDRLAPLGTKPRKIRLLFQALRFFYPATQSFVLYDHQVAGLPAIN